MPRPRKEKVYSTDWSNMPFTPAPEGAAYSAEARQPNGGTVLFEIRGPSTPARVLTLERLTLVPGNAATIWRDADKDEAGRSRGLGLRIAKGGGKVWVFEGRIRGAGTLRLTIGDALVVSSNRPGSRITLQQARDTAERYMADCRAGIDPKEGIADRIAEKAAEKRARDITKAAQSITLGDVWRLYVQDRIVQRSASYLESHREVVQPGGEPRKYGRNTVTRRGTLTMPGPLVDLLDQPLASIDADLIQSWMVGRDNGKPSAVTAMAYGLLRGCLRWCSEQTRMLPFTAADDMGKRDQPFPFDVVGKLSLPPPLKRGHKPVEVVDGVRLADLVKPKSWLSRNVTESLYKFVPRKEDKFTNVELPHWLMALPEVSDQMAQCYLFGLLLTGARRDELASIQWGAKGVTDVGGMVIDGKTGQRVIPLPAFYRQMLTDMRKGLPHDLRESPFVFASTGRRGYVYDFARAHKALQDHAGLQPSPLPGHEYRTLHALRRAFVSHTRTIGVPIEVRASISGHKLPGVLFSAYLDVHETDRVAAMTLWLEFLLNCGSTTGEHGRLVYEDGRLVHRRGEGVVLAVPKGLAMSA